MKSRRTLVIALVCLCVLLAIGLKLRYPHDPLTLCQKQLDSAFAQWTMENGTNVYPNVEGDSRRSFALVGQYMLNGDEYYAKYGYVPGLKDDDPPELVLMYLKEKTRRTWNGDSSGSIRRKPKWMVIGPSFGCDLPEGGRLEETAVFRTRLQKTLEFLQENSRPYWTNAVREHAAFLNSLSGE